MGIKETWKEGVERQRDAREAAEAAKRESKTEGPGKAWDDGYLCYVHTVRFEWTKVRDLDTSQEVDAVLRIGWKLQSTAMTFVERTGFNNITCMFTFVRP